MVSSTRSSLNAGLLNNPVAVRDEGLANKGRLVDIGEVGFGEQRREAMPQKSDATNPSEAPVTLGSLQSATLQSSHSKDTLSEAIRGEYQYAKLGLGLGLAAIIGGVVLGLNGVAGSTSWTAKVLGFESNLNDAAPGVVLFIVGIFFIFFTRPRVKIGKMQG